jgi:hypothetical protein
LWACHPSWLSNMGKKHTKLINGKKFGDLEFLASPQKKKPHLPMHLSKQCLRATSHTIPRARDQYTSLVEKVEQVQVRFTLRLRDQRSMWIQSARILLNGSVECNYPILYVLFIYNKLSWNSTWEGHTKGEQQSIIHDHGIIEIYDIISIICI